MHRRLGNSAVPGNLLGLARLYERIINDEPPLAIQGARIGSHSVFHFFPRQMFCCTRDSCHTFPLLFSVITSFILSQYADWYETLTIEHCSTSILLARQSPASVSQSAKIGKVGHVMSGAREKFQRREKKSQSLQAQIRILPARRQPGQPPGSDAREGNIRSTQS